MNMLKLKSDSSKFNRDGNTGRGSGSHAKENAESDAVADSEQDRYVTILVSSHKS